MTYEAQDFDHLLGTEGFSDQLLKNHFSLYEGYVTNVNQLEEDLVYLVQEGKATSPKYAELKRRFGWEFNGMRLHEYYFGNMTKNQINLNEDSELYKKIGSDFGSFDKWEEDFKATGSIRGIGWAALCLDPIQDCLFNIWINEHDVGLLASAPIILIMDVFEHAFMIDYGIKKAGYIASFFKTIDWDEVESRYSMSQHKFTVTTGK